MDVKLGVYTLPVIAALRRSADREELAGLLAPGPPEGERLVRALQIVRSDGNLDHARRAVAREVNLATELSGRLPEGPARSALASLAAYLAARCGAA